jgi:hypothetical protein
MTVELYMLESSEVQFEWNQPDPTLWGYQFNFDKPHSPDSSEWNPHNPDYKISSTFSDYLVKKM